jgi:hypothetical protein
MRVPRMTTRRWIVMIVISASLMGIVAEVNRHLKYASDYRSRAFWYSVAEKINRGEVVTIPGGMTIGRSVGSPTLAAYYHQMKRKYARAATHPWLPVAPDGPAPQP